MTENEGKSDTICATPQLLKEHFCNEDYVIILQFASYYVCMYTISDHLQELLLIQTLGNNNNRRILKVEVYITKEA